MANTLSPSEIFTTIIKKRILYGNALRNTQQKLSVTKNLLESVEQEKRELLESVTNNNIKEKLLNINIHELISAIKNEDQDINRYLSRFLKKTINVGVVGLARQGKSQLISSLTGLDESTIPTGNYGHCIGTRSTIIHSNTSESYGEVYFYDEKSFIDKIITPYYKELLDLKYLPKNIEEFEKINLTPLPENKQENLSNKLKYERLQTYKSELNKYRHLLYENGTRKISINQIREYIAQDNKNGERIYYNYLAVKEIKIFCAFPYKDMENIAFIDMPGLGDTGILSENQLMEVISNDIDILLFTKMPSGMGDIWKSQEIELYDTIKKTVAEIPIETWGYLLMNHIKSESVNEDNFKNCKQLINELPEEMGFVSNLIVDFSNKEEVQNILQNHILQDGLKKINYIDDLYMSDLQKKLTHLKEKVSTQINNIKIISNMETGQNQFIFHNFSKLFRTFSKKLYIDLEEYLEGFRAQKDSANECIIESIRIAQERSYKNTDIPTIEEIEETRNILGSYKSAYEYYLNNTRVCLTYHFLELENGLNKAVDIHKRNIIEILKNKDLLHQFSTKNDVEFLNEIISSLSNNNCTLLCFSFKMLKNFQLPYQGLFYHRFRKKLDCLIPDSGIAEISPKPSAKEVLDVLTAMHNMVLENLKNELELWPFEVNQILYATIEYFLYSILRAHNIIDEWQVFCLTSRSRIWPEHFQVSPLNNELKQSWRARSEYLSEINESI
ncbi:MAG: hypothetical protein QM669_01415 [Siphonobacter sp.]